MAPMLWLRPRLVPRVWGGRRLAAWFGEATEEPVGEAWLVFDENPVLNGPWAGRPLVEVLDELGPGFLGPRAAGAFPHLPFLVKLIEAEAWLSVQVHPDDAYARAHEAKSGYSGKHEAWVVLKAAPGARIVYGLKQPVDRATLAEAAKSRRILELLNFVPVEEGDVIYVPAGVIHALGPGLLVLEVQQCSDLTYRLYDYGRGRALHLEKALDVARLDPVPLKKRRLEPGVFLQTPHFSLAAVEGTFQAPKKSAAALSRLFAAAPGGVLAAGAETTLPEGRWLAAWV